MRRSWLPLLTLGVGLATTVLATWFAANYFEAKTRGDFNDAVGEPTTQTLAHKVFSKKWPDVGLLSLFRCP